MAIHIKKSHKGLLHKDTGTPAGEPIPAAKLAAAKNSSDPAVRRRATFAVNAKHFDHSGGHHRHSADHGRGSGRGRVG